MVFGYMNRNYEEELAFPPGRTTNWNRARRIRDSRRIS